MSDRKWVISLSIPLSRISAIMIWRGEGSEVRVAALVTSSNSVLFLTINVTRLRISVNTLSSILF